MKHLIKTILLFICFSAYAAEYETYVQVDPSSERNHLFVLALTKSLNNKEDIASATFTLEPGETGNKNVRNKILPNRIYEFEVTVEKNNNGKLNVLVVTSVSNNNGELIHKNKVQVHGYNSL